MFLLAIGFIIIVLDQLSKYLTHISLPLNEGAIPIFYDWLGIDFYLSYVANKGAAWGVLAGQQGALNFFRVLVIVLLIFYIFFRPKAKVLNYPLVFIAFGAIGNVLDYFLYGYVIDMLKFVLWGYHYPVFNIADSCIFIGVFWFFGLSVTSKTDLR